MEPILTIWPHHACYLTEADNAAETAGSTAWP